MRCHRGCGSQIVMIGRGWGGIAVGDKQKEKYIARRVRNGSPEPPEVGRRQPASTGPVHFGVLVIPPPLYTHMTLRGCQGRGSGPIGG